LSLLLLAAVVAARLSALTIDEISLGEHAQGPRLTTQDLEGKVVLVDFWGVKCPDCIAEMPGYQQLYQRYKDDGFHLVAMEKQHHHLPEINDLLSTLPTLRDAGLQYQITYGDVGAANQPHVPGHYVAYLPANFLFSSDGNLVATNVHGDDLEGKIRELLEETWLKRIKLSAGDLATPALSEILARLKSGHNMMEALKDLAVKKRSPEYATDAAKIFNAVFTAAYAKFDEAERDRGAKPFVALYRFAALARDFKGCELGMNAARKEAELRADPRVDVELVAESQLREIINHIRDLRPAGGGGFDPNNPEFQRINRAALIQLFNECIQLNNRFPGTTAGQHVGFIMDDMHLREIR
jgi:thiol-disulfide isomerase/thioredoxin